MGKRELRALSQLAGYYDVTLDELQRFRDRDETFPEPVSGYANTGYLYDTLGIGEWLTKRKTTVHKKISRRDERSSLAARADLTLRSGLYFAQCESFVKIGVAQSVRTRISALQVCNPYPVALLGYISITSVAARRKAEAAWHQRWAKIHHRGEWFHATPELLAEIEEVGSVAKMKVTGGSSVIEATEVKSLSELIDELRDVDENITLKILQKAAGNPAESGFPDMQGIGARGAYLYDPQSVRIWTSKRYAQRMVGK